MLAELQHLQTLITALTTQLHDKRLENEQLQAKLAKTVVNPADEQARQALTQQHAALQAQYAQSEKEKSELAERHTTLEQAYGQLQATYQQLKSSHELYVKNGHEQQHKLTLEFEQFKQHLSDERAQFATGVAQLEAERDALLRKNEFAKQKVEAIIHRLSQLGQTTPTADTAN